MNEQLATTTRNEESDLTTRVGPAIPIFVDGSGRRRRIVTLLGWLVAVSCVAYLGIIGISMTGTSVGPLPEVPSAASNSVVFGSDVDAMPQGALEFPVPMPVIAPQASKPSATASSMLRVRMAGTSR